MKFWRHTAAQRMPAGGTSRPPGPFRSTPIPSMLSQSMLSQSLLFGSILLLTQGPGCTRYDYLVEEVYEQVRYSNQVDILFVFDNSQSMAEEQQALAENSSRFVQSIAAAALQDQAAPKETLSDAVTNYLFFVNNFSRFIDFRLAVTTTEVEVDPFSSAPLEEGVDGLFFSPFPDDPSLEPFLTLQSPDVVKRFSDELNDIPLTAAGSQEKGLDAMRRALCLTLDDPSLLTRADAVVDCSDIRAEEVGVNGAFLRPDVALVTLIISDEGDSSQAPVDDYLDFLDRMGLAASITVIAPTIGDTAETSCNPESAPAASIQRYSDAADKSGGLVLPVCGNFSDALDNVTALINTLLMRFRLKQVPQPGSLLVFVNGTQVSEDASNGWQFIPGTNSLEFHGSAVPDYSARIEVYYRAVAAVDPRPLPF